MQCKFILYLYICKSVEFISHSKKRKVICRMTRTEITHLAEVVFLKLRNFRASSENFSTKAKSNTMFSRNS